MKDEFPKANTRKLKSFSHMKDDEGLIRGYHFWCPGCDRMHTYRVRPRFTDGKGPVWKFNKDVENPTFTPSLLVNLGGKKSCHMYLTNGKIRYLNDSYHDLAGEEGVEMGELPNWLYNEDDEEE